MSTGPVGPQAPTTLGGWIVWGIIAAALVAALYIALGALGIGIPPWVIQLLMVCGIAFVAVLVVKFLLSLKIN
jgi:hypothetical protein